MPCWPKALEALARYMVILLTVGYMPFPGDYVKVGIKSFKPIKEKFVRPFLARPATPLRSLDNWELRLVRSFSLRSLAALDLLLKWACMCLPRHLGEGVNLELRPGRQRHNFTSSDMMLLLHSFDRRHINVLGLSCNLWLFWVVLGDISCSTTPSRVVLSCQRWCLKSVC
jgi:hypothetical protein